MPVEMCCLQKVPWGTEWDEGYSVTLDASGNAYMTGYFDSPTITFDSYTLTDAGNGDISL